MQCILKDIKESSDAEIAILGAQSYIIKFYEYLEFSVCSDEYIDAGIPHKNMRLELRRKKNAGRHTKNLSSNYEDLEILVGR
jgi:predicted GNAT family N-acyltransferase